MEFFLFIFAIVGICVVFGYSPWFIVKILNLYDPQKFYKRNIKFLWVILLAITVIKIIIDIFILKWPVKQAVYIDDLFKIFPFYNYIVFLVIFVASCIWAIRFTRLEIKMEK